MVILRPSRAVSDADPKISHPISAECAGAATLAESASARDVVGSAIGAPRSHARARPVATRPKNFASYLLQFICSSLPMPTRAASCIRPGVLRARRRTSGTRERGTVVSRESLARKENHGRQAKAPGDPSPARGSKRQP